MDDIDLLEQLCDDVIEGSLCQLGGSAPNPVLTTLRYFRDEVEAHVVDKRCPAKVCRPLIRYTHRQGRLHRLPRLLRRPAPRRRHQRRAQAAAQDRPEALHQVRHLPPGVQVRRRRRRHRHISRWPKGGRREPSYQDDREVHHRRQGRRAPRAGETVLSAAQRAGIDIPALCHQEGMAAWGACRLCLIEVEGWGKLQAACTTWVADGLVVHTQSERVRAKRESYLKMYLSDHNAYCEAPCSSRLPHAHRHPGLPQRGRERRHGRRGGHRAPRAALPRHPRPHLPALLRARVPPRRGRRPDRHLRPAPGGRRPCAGGAACRGGHRSPRGRHRRRPGRPLAAPGSSRRRATRSPSTTPTRSPAACCATASPSSACPRRCSTASWRRCSTPACASSTASPWATKSTLEGLLDAGFDAVFVGVGAWHTAPSRIPGSQAVLDSLDMLRKLREGKKVRLTETVAVIGDGTAALDAARTARRLGAKHVAVLARHDAAGIEAGARDHAAALEEGVDFEYSVRGQARQGRPRTGGGRGVRAPGPRRRQAARAARLALRPAGHDRDLRRSLRARPRRERRRAHALGVADAGGQLLHRPHGHAGRVRRRRRRHRRQVGHPCRRRRQAGGPGHRRLLARRRPGAGGGQAGPLRRPALPRPAP